VPIAASVRTTVRAGTVPAPGIRSARSPVVTTMVGRGEHDRRPFDRGNNRVAIARLRGRKVGGISSYDLHATR